MSQTSIEWLVNIVQSCIAPDFIPQEIIQRAKEMHKKECFSFYEKGADDEFNGISNNAFEYYKEKFGIENEQ